ncbi:zonular occludens toxin domain-containing protein [Acinetobacter baumannii]|uniref:zonular occludens toxin domain-containing protein n=1 Tax=Acinetobacter baumannii TaxID=470 RepID=UPI001D170966|nr:zonular occludens toxin domain-containing protein [Acinetobacter baumannii]
MNLVCGQPRNGKSQFMVKTILDMLEENKKLEEQGKPARQIYCDIDGLRIPEVEPAPDDWRDTPDGSIIIYDEVHMRKAYEYKGNQYSQDQMIKDLTIHGHFNKDIWLITQDPARIEKGIHKLIDKMYFIKRPSSKPPYTNVFVFDKWLSSPEPAANRNAKHKKYFDHYRFHFKDEYQKLYHSASDHSSIKFKLPKQLFIYVSIILGIAGFVVFGLMNTKSFNPQRFEDKQSASDTKKDSKKTDQTANQKTDEQNLLLDQQCSKQYGLTIEQCADLRDPTKRNAELLAKEKNDMQSIVLQYNPNKPYDIDASQVSYEITSKPVFSGCMKQNGRYVAYTQQGTILHDVSQSDCRRLLKHAGDRPFNYFAQPRNEPMNTEALRKDSVEQVPQRQQPIQYAENYIQRGLERDPNWDL